MGIALAVLVGSEPALAAGAHGRAAGDQLWMDAFQPDQLSAGSDFVAVSPDDHTTYVASQIAGPNQRWAIVAYDATDGSRRWVTLSPPDWNYAIAEAMAISPDGSQIFLTGSATTPDDNGTQTVAYDATDGSLEWVSHYAGPMGPGEGLSIAVAPDGATVYVAAIDQGFNIAEYATIAYDAGTGSQRWAALYSGPSNRAYPAKIAVSPDGTRVFVTGRSFYTTSRIATIDYDAATGDEEWMNAFSDGPWNAEAIAMGVAPDGHSVFVAGMTLIGQGSTDFVLVALGQSREWVRHYTSPAPSQDTLSGLAVAPDGSNVYVTGTSYLPGGPQISTLAYRQSSGAPVWASPSARCQTTPGIAAAMTISPDAQRLYITGQGPGADSQTVAYDAVTCETLWVASYIGPQHDDWGAAIGVSHSGATVFVAGSSFVAPHSFAATTIAYKTN